MSGFYISDKRIDDLKKTNRYLSRRGQDKIIVKQRDGLSYIYNIFLLKNDNDFFYEDENYIVFYDGVVFDSKDKSFSGTSRYLLDLYREYGIEFVKQIDGEYSICFVDFEKKIIVFSRDLFGTKQLWYSAGDGFAISSYKSSIVANEKKCNRAQINTTYVMDFTGQILDMMTNYNMDLKQHKDSYDDWCHALELAVKKRILTDEIVGIGLSSGHDSGVVFGALKKQTDNFISMSFIGKENKEVLFERMAMHGNSMLLEYEENEFLVTLKNIYRNCEPFDEKFNEKDFFSLLKDEPSTGLAIMCNNLKKKNVKLYFSGNEYEILPFIDEMEGGRKHKIDYHKEIRHQFPSDLTTIYPWTDKYVVNVFKERDDYVTGCYGIQATYPLFDKMLVQEFMWLSKELKNRAYKAPYEAFFKKIKLPYCMEKAGFFVRDDEA